MKNFPTPDENGRYSWETYLQLEAESELPYEYHDGEIVAMAGASLAHGRICSNCNHFLYPSVDKKGCLPITAEAKVYRFNRKEYFYPDFVVTCNPLDLQSTNIIRNPLLVIEVLSESTRVRDLTIKLREYLLIPTLQHYIIIEQTRCEVMHWAKNEAGEWMFYMYTQMEDEVSLPQLGTALSLENVYRHVTFGPEPDIVQEPPGVYESQMDT